MRDFWKFTLLLLVPFLTRAQVSPSATILPVSQLNCTNKAITFSCAVSGSPTTYTWSVVPVKGLVAYSNLNTNTLSLTFSINLTYTVYLNVTNAFGTTVTFTTITPARTASASFNASLNTEGYPAQLVLTNYSSNNVVSYWKFNDIGGIDSNFNTVKNYDSGGSYSVTLIAKGQKGCNDTTGYAFRIADSAGITLPNVFTPNNDDVNDVYRPITRGIRYLKARVISRSGIEIHVWDKVNGFWDGYTDSGVPCEEGVYFITVEAIDFLGKSYKLKGTITLLR